MQFSAEGDAQRFAAALDESAFGNYFLAMRPFKCIAHPSQHVCHFLYRTMGSVSAEDFAKLEYALLFMRKKPQEVNVNPWNGMYYRLVRVGDRLEGTLHEVDMNPLIVAPFDTKERLIQSSDLHPAHPRSHRFPKLVIE